MYSCVCQASLGLEATVGGNYDRSLLCPIEQCSAATLNAKFRFAPFPFSPSIPFLVVKQSAIASIVIVEVCYFKWSNIINDLEHL